MNRPQVIRTASRPRAAWAPRWSGDARNFVDELIGWLVSVGREPRATGVTLLDQSLQAADLARRDDAREEHVLAALLHDIGGPLRPLLQLQGPDLGAPERVGASWLARYYPAAVTEPIRLHVEAARWLVACEGDPAARQVAADRDGPMDAEERAAFEAEPHAAAALALCRWKAGAAVPGRRVPPLDVYRPALVRAARTLR